MKKVLNPDCETFRWESVRSYVYMLFCQDEGPLYVKIGRSRNPIRRLASLVPGCPVKPKMLAVTATRSINDSHKLEQSLHHEFRKWRTSHPSEWFKFSMDEKQQFNDGWKRVFVCFKELGWKLSWRQASVAELLG